MKGIIINWAGTLATIPTDWLLCDGNNSTPNLLGKYLLSVGTGENPGTTGGSATHTHDSPAHGHTQDAHSHSGNTNAGGAASTNVSSWINQPYAFSVSNHVHSLTTSSTTATNQTATVTVNTASNDPSYYKVAPIIDNTSYGVKYPANSLIFWGQPTLPLGWSLCDGSDGTPDLRNKFLKCVDSAENPGGTGGSATHTHTTTAHNHTQDTHTHTGNTNYDTEKCVDSANEMFVYYTQLHTHIMTISSDVAVNQEATPTMDTINGEPTFKKLLILKNTGVANRPKYAIVVWTGTLANIPLGYVLCDGNNGTPNFLDYFIKGANDASGIGDTGGSSVHGHTADSHNHTQNSHSHTISANSVNALYGKQNGTGKFTMNTHSHTVNALSTTATNQSTTITINNCSSQANYPPYYKVAYIMQDRELDVGAYAFMI